MGDEKTSNNPQDGGENYDDEPDESVGERMWGLTEMFPESVRNFAGKVTNATVKSFRSVYQFSCNASWIFFTSSVILFAPVIFETERAQMEELHKSQQKQVLLGPGSAMAASGPAPNLPLIR
ncbi:mitochondrial import receptor subunit TOM22 homolog isoform X2 [Scaptodrosophila lebanonensis]|uniref:Mitochondrial import receptor subunit TOM22 homolog n=1 Tax=Drosophila lebanonensis TaxID=7225 RepID=A0A6J2TZI5_DROLE|nr:mitochondrial import receptor subunit TOM22 homolog isoform X2 [Scaptodrosophila lebanonensis]